MSEHTKGKWEVVKSEPNYVDIKDSTSGTTVCSLTDFYGNDDEIARLIAKAPDMLSMLEKFKRTIEISEVWWIDSPGYGGFDLDKIQNLLTEIKGE